MAWVRAFFLEIHHNNHKMKKVIWKSADVIMKAGAILAETDIHLEKGERILAAAHSVDKPGKIVNLGLFEGAQEISAPMAIPFWERSNAGLFLDGFKPLAFTGGGTVTVRLSTKVALASDVQVQVVFGIIQTDTSC